MIEGRNVIQVENVSKIYRLGNISFKTFTEDLRKLFRRNKENTISNKPSENPTVAALDEVTFKVTQGEVVGFIGKNGAGKSTILKILSKITKPTKGKIAIKGRVASLLEVGTGFHPELTGRENIYLNGAILGMKSKEITSNLDRIIDFSGVEKFIDTPVKRYSSGMRVRLGFAVAAFLKSDILIVDEVLAVGDAEFQRKAIGRMKEASSEQGRTVLFVSHNTTAILGLCTRAICLSNGKIVSSGNPSETVSKYLKENLITESSLNLSQSSNLKGYEGISINKILINNDIVNTVFNTEPVKISIQILTNPSLIGPSEIAGRIRDSNGMYLHYFGSKLKSEILYLKKEENWVHVEFPYLPFNEGTYLLDFEVKISGIVVYRSGSSIELHIKDKDFYKSGIEWNRGKILLEQSWSQS